MSRAHSTDKKGKPFLFDVKMRVWSRAVPKNLNMRSDGLLQDVYGSLMKWEYGNTKSEYGWEIDHIQPVSRDGDDNLDNLQPLQWRNNRKKGDTFPPPPFL